MTATDEALALARVAVAAAADKKARDIVVLDVSDQLPITDCFVIASAPNERQVQAVVDEVEEKLREHGTKPARREGAREGRWVLLDFVDVVVHVQHTDERGFYGLDRLWKDCPRVRFPEAEVPPSDGSLSGKSQSGKSLSGKSQSGKSPSGESLSDDEAGPGDAAAGAGPG